MAVSKVNNILHKLRQSVGLNEKVNTPRYLVASVSFSFLAVTNGSPIILESTAVVVLAANKNCFPTSACFNGSDSWQPYHTRI